VLNESNLSSDLIDFASDDFLDNPWPVYQKLREEQPVYWSTTSNAFFLSRYEDVFPALSDPNIASGFPLRTSRRIFGRTVLDTDGDEHRAFRKMFLPMFRGSGVRQLRSQIVEPAADAVIRTLLEQVDSDGLLRTDFMDSVATAVPYAMATRLLGVPLDDVEWLRPRVLLLAGAVEFPSTPLEDARAAKAELDEYFINHFSKLDKQRPDSLLNLIDRDPLIDDRHQLSLASLLLLGATETSVSAIGKILHTLLVHEIPFKQLEDSNYRENIVRETLRWEPPSHTVVRYTVRDTSIRGVDIPRRSAVLLSIASANRDDGAFASADQWLPDRKERRMLSFSAGPHSCLGMQLALAEFDVIFARLAQHFESGELLDRTNGVRRGLWRVRERGMIFRKMDSLPVTLYRRDCE
jgi:cytochrome P450